MFSVRYHGVAVGRDGCIYLSHRNGVSKANYDGTTRDCVCYEHMINGETRVLSNPGRMALDPIRNWLFFTDNTVLPQHMCASSNSS